MAGYNHNDIKDREPHIYHLYEEYKGRWHRKASWSKKSLSRFGTHMTPEDLIKEAKSYKIMHDNGRRVKIEIIL